MPRFSLLMGMVDTPLASTAHGSSWEMGALPYWGKECA